MTTKEPRSKSLLTISAITLAFATIANANERDVIFPLKMITNTPHLYSAIGTMTGDGVYFKRNTYRFVCRKERQYCAITHVELNSYNQLSSISFPLEFPIQKWTETEIVWGDAELNRHDCEHSRFIADLKNNELNWYSESVNAQLPHCKALYNGNTWSYHWKLSDGFRGNETRK